MSENALAERFSTIFREEHRAVRDGLLDLVEAFPAKDRERIQTRLADVARLTGPHFRYEEESLYPALVEIFGREYIDKLLVDHDGAIAGAKALVELAGGPLSAADTQRAVRLLRAILPHVSDCDGLSIMVERFPEAQVREIFEARERSNREGVDLITWADTIRARPRVAAAAN